ncbi:beta-1,6-N-acetylglucosaminyltransferase [Mucilaginibacter corticis]|uniref:Peptide O-xylosyltransferase n=1 Tax=Mucilaginibacter corticis TaxID=2597670 RepID=A0A556MLI9_9SPHI|nr:beta-1,6-N-acetylglucosaminyltransferase [Mucilaginibacter corticis]TSJ40753.1 beta-1,6-N-acetylglucosaminyltransferase [Mucilaginibacter corticis]
MRIAHIIMAHKNPPQLLRLIERLQHPNFDIFIHIDKKVPLDNFFLLKEKTNITFIKNRVECNWGGNNFFKAIISSVNEVIHLQKNYAFVSLLSGQDYPITTAENIYNYFLQNSNKNFISYDPSRQSNWWKGAVNRYEKYHFTDVHFKWKYVLQTIVNIVLPRRKFPYSFKLFGGRNASWWTITGDCAKYLVDELMHDKKLWDFLKYSWCTDEFMVCSIIMNSKFRHDTVNNNLRYIDWSEGNARPKLLGMADFDHIKQSGMLFARKFDQDIESQILDKIDRDCSLLSSNLA